MKQKFSYFSCIVLMCLVLTGCISREQADRRLVQGCRAAITAFLEDGYVIQDVRETSFTDISDKNGSYRAVNLAVTESDDWDEVEKEYRCTFIEEFTFAKMSHRASVYRFEAPDQLVGNKDGQIHGALEDHIKLENAVRDIFSH